MPPGSPNPSLPRAVLLVGVLAVSTAAVLIRLCDAPSLVIATYRLVLASLVVVPAELLRTRALPARRDLGWCVLAGLPLGPYSRETLGFLVLLALVPQLVGHTSINWSLAHLTAPTVSVAILGEPIGASLLAWWVLGEVPGLGTVAGGALICTGIVLALGWAEPA